MSVENSIGNGTFKINNGKIAIDIIPDTVETVGPVSTTGYDGEVLLPSGNVLMTSKQLVTYNPSTKVTSTLINTTTHYEKSAYLLSPWTARTVTSVNWKAIVWAAELGLFVAIASASSGIMTSPDGIYWTYRTGVSATWTSIVWAPEIGLLVAVAATNSQNQNFITSPDGINWTVRVSGLLRNWQAVAWAPEIGLFAAVNNNNVATSVMTSPDGINWTGRTALAGVWAGITWAPELGLFVAIGTNVVMTSPDGITWTSRTNAINNPWKSIAWAPELGLFTAVATSGTNCIMTSRDGITWTVQTAPASNTWNGIIWAPEISLFVAVGSSGSKRILTSPDGITWTATRCGSNDSIAWQAIAWSPSLGMFAATATSGTRCMTATFIKKPKQSFNITGSEAWLSRTVPSASSWQGIAWSPQRNLFAAVASGSGTVTDRVMTSIDGITWTAQTVADALSWNAIVWAPELGLFAAVASGGATTTSVMTSSDGVTWTRRTVIAAISWNAIAWSPEIGLFVAVGSGGTTTNSVMYSGDGSTWTSSAVLPAALSWNGIVWSSELYLFVAVASGGTTANSVMTSPDGTTWTSSTVPAALSWKAIAWAPELRLFAAVSSDGGVMTSPNGTTWTTQTTPVTLSFQSIEWASDLGLFIAVASSGGAMTSSNGTTWTSLTVPVANNWTAITWAPSLGVFAAVANTGTVNDMVMTLPYTKQTITDTGTFLIQGNESWVSRAIPVANTWRSVAWSPELGLFAAVSNNGTNRVMTSPDGINWTVQNPPNTSTWTSIAWSPQLGLFVAVAVSGTNPIMRSADGINWTTTYSGSTQFCKSIAWSQKLGLFCGVLSGTLYFSFNAIAWTHYGNASTAGSWVSVTWAEELSMFVAVGISGTYRVLTSGNPVTGGTGRTAAEANAWQSVAWSPQLGLLAAVASTGTNRVMTSRDGINWTARAAAAANQWQSITWASELGLFVALSIDGDTRVMTSSDGINWSLQTDAPANEWQSITWSPKLGLFVAASSNGFMTKTYNSSLALSKNTAIQMTDGRTVLIPSIKNKTITVYNTLYNTILRNGPAIRNNFSYRSAVLLSDNRILLVPFYGTNIRVGIYTPNTTTGTLDITTKINTNGGYLGGVLINNDTVLFVPALYGTTVGIYTISTNALVSHATALTGFNGGVLLNDGRVLLVPNTATKIGLYDPTTDTLSEGVSATGYSNGKLLSDGTVILFPNTASQVARYNPVDNTIEFGASATGYNGGVVSQNGTIIMTPNTGKKVAIYRPKRNMAIAKDITVYGKLKVNSVEALPTVNTELSTNTKEDFLKWLQGITTVRKSAWWANATTLQFAEATFAGTSLDGSNTLNTAKYSDGILMPDGRVVFVPYNSNKLGIYNPSANTFTESTFTGTSLDGVSTAKYSGGVLMPDGRVAFIPLNSNKLGIYNPSANTFTESAFNDNTIDGANPSTNKYSGGVLTSDGRGIVFVPSIPNLLGIYNTLSNTFAERIFTGTSLNGNRTLNKSPKFLSATVIDSNSLLTWPSTGWVLSASSVGTEGTVLGASDYSSSDIWINNSTATFAVAPEQWIKLQYPSAVVVKSYAITSRNNTSSWFPSQWRLQGSSDNAIWIDLEAVRNETTWVQGTDKVYTDNINTDNVAYLYYRLRITNSRESTSISTNTRVAIAEWKLYSTGATLTDSKYNGSVLMPDGRIVLVPQTSNKLAIFNPTSNTFVESITTGTTLDGTVTSADKYSGGVLIPDGRVVFVPLNSNKLGIYNPTTNIFVENTYANTTLNGSDSTVAKYTGGVLAPDGRVIFVPTNSNKLGIYNPTTDTFTESTYSGTTLDGSVTGSGKYTGGVLLPDGRILFIPRDSNKLGILSGFAPVPKELCLHPCFNKF